jgi:hypothetical protein
MDLITADPTPVAAAASPAAVPQSQAQQPSALGKPAGEKRSKRSALMQIHSDTVSAAKAALNPVRTNIMPQKQKKKKVNSLSLSLCLFHSLFVILLRNCERNRNGI